jgi:hypothetical protein
VGVGVGGCWGWGPDVFLASGSRIMGVSVCGLVFLDVGF